MGYIIGLDLGQASDYTALCLLARVAAPVPEPEYFDSFRLVVKRWPPRAPDTFHCVLLERLDLGTTYPQIVEYVAGLLALPALARQTTLVIDQTGVDAPVADMLRGARLDPVCITITSGLSVTKLPHGHGVPKKDLVSSVLCLLQTGRLKFADGLPHVETLIEEAQNFQVKNTDAGHEQFGTWREGAHDDLLLATALAAWFGAHGSPIWVIPPVVGTW